MTHGVRHLQLDYDVTYSLEQLISLIRVVAPSSGLDKLTLGCAPEGLTDAVTDTQKVTTLIFRCDKLCMTEITSLLLNLEVEHINLAVNKKFNVYGEVKRIHMQYMYVCI